MGVLSKNERDVGICAALICPHCQRLTKLMLREVSAGVGFLSWHLFEVDRGYQLFCVLCGFRRHIDNHELIPARTAIGLFARLENGEITPAQYLHELEGLDFPTLHALRDEAMVWTCPHCMEKVPEELSQCWKCNSPRSELQNAAPTEKFQSPELPRDITRPSNPWEGP